MLAGDLDWVVSDHACCKDEQKFGDPRDDIFAAKSGFGGAEYLLPGLVSEGRKRGLSYRRIAELTAWNPARRYGLPTQGHHRGRASTRTSASSTRRRRGRCTPRTPSRRRSTPRSRASSWAPGSPTRGSAVSKCSKHGNIVGTPTGRFLRRGTVGG